MNSAWKSYGCIFVAGCLWGTNGLFVKLMQGAGSISAYTGFVRIALSLLILTVITLVKEGPKAFKISKNTLISCALLGLVCQALYNYVYSSAINSLGVSFACVMTYMAPAFATSGLLFGLASAACYSLVGIFGRLASGESSPFVVATYNFLFGTIFLGLFGHPWTTVADPMDLKILAYGFVYALIPTGICYIIYFNGVSKIKESSKVPVIASVENVVAVIVGVMVFHEKVGIGNLAGIVLVLGSIAVMNMELPISGKSMPKRVSVTSQEHAHVQ